MKAAIVVLDAGGCIGRAVVEAALKAQWPVIAVSQDQRGLKQLAASHRGANLSLLAGGIEQDSDAGSLATALRELDRPLAGIVVAQCREPERGSVLAQPTQALQQALHEELLPQLSAARALIPQLAASGRNGHYLVIGGPGDENPWAGYGLRSIAAAATRMLLRVLHDEARALSVRVQLLAVAMPARTDENEARACEQWPSARTIGERAVALIAQENVRESGQAVVRFAWNAAPAFPAQRAATAAKPHAASKPAGEFSAATSLARAPEPGLDDTWARLKPLLTSTAF